MHYPYPIYVWAMELYDNDINIWEGWNGAYRNNARVAEKTEAGACKAYKGMNPYFLNTE